MLELLAFKGFTVRIGDPAHPTGRHAEESYEERLLIRAQLLQHRRIAGQARGAAQRAHDALASARLGPDASINSIRQEGERLQGIEKRERTR